MRRPGAGSRFRMRAAAVIAAIVPVLVAGCAGVPTSGPIEQGEQVGVEREDQFIRVIARPPRAGMTPEQVVQGFLDASASFDGDHAVARQYLTRAADITWRPAAGVVVYDGTVDYAERPGDEITVTAPLAGSIDDIGRFEVADPGRVTTTTFRLAQVDGEWRITALPPGLLLSRSDVDRAFRTYDVYFFDPTFAVLVPDPRTIPVIGPALPTTLARALLAGPSDWLAPAVRTAVPQGTALALDAVPVDAGVARVDLTAVVRATDDDTRRALSQQLVWTLRQVPDVTAIDITSGGLPLPVPGVGSPQPQDAWPGVDPGGLPAGSTPYLVVDGQVRRSLPEGIEPVPGEAGEGRRSLGAIAVSYDGFRVAGLDDRGAVWVGPMTTGGQLRRVLGRAAAGPTFARDGAIWTVDRDGQVQRILDDGSVAAIPVEGLPPRTTLVSLVLSRDGTRAALVVRSGGRTGLLVARVERRGDDLRLTAPIRVESRLTEVSDVSWSDAEGLAVLGSDGAGPLQVFVVDVARGTLRAVGSPSDPLSVAAAPGLPLLVAAADGSVYQVSGGLWKRWTDGTSPAYPG